ncbi:hypothetical protein PGQ11_009088 [Apiospora arundinis]|uniref:AA1-like domain-containing protein n=1 Tax=Apiospora arundinis TaxID=335852 RepID=A0ABR2IIH4_9PEZI
MEFVGLLCLAYLALAAPSQAPSDFSIVNLYAEVIPHSSSSRYECNPSIYSMHPTFPSYVPILNSVKQSQTRFNPLSPTSSVYLLMMGCLHLTKPKNSYSFDLSTSTNTIATSCTATPRTESNGELVNVTRTPCSDDARYTWAWTILATTDPSSSGGSTNTTCNIEYWFDGPAYSLYAAHHVPADQIVWTNQQSPTGTVQAYAGPANFTVPVDKVY